MKIKLISATILLQTLYLLTPMSYAIDQTPCALSRDYSKLLFNLSCTFEVYGVEEVTESNEEKGPIKSSEFKLSACSSPNKALADSFIFELKNGNLAIPAPAMNFMADISGTGNKENGQWNIQLEYSVFQEGAVSGISGVPVLKPQVNASVVTSDLSSFQGIHFGRNDIESIDLRLVKN